MDLKHVVQQLKSERDRLDKAIHALEGVSTPGRAVTAGKLHSRRLSASARARIAAAQRARWAKHRESTAKSAKVVPIRRKRTLSAAARAKIAAAQKKRWAKVRAGKKS